MKVYGQMDLKEIAMKTPDNVNDTITTAAAKMTGGAALVGAYGLTLNEWVAALTILYMLLQIILLLPRYVNLISGIIKRWKR